MGKRSKKERAKKATNATPNLTETSGLAAVSQKMDNKMYESELFKLQTELVKLQEWVKATGARIVIIFEGRDAAGKGGIIKRIAERTSPRVFRVVALPSPTEREKSQIYMQRYVDQLPAGGEIVIFDRSWYNRAGVEYVMGFCTKDQYTKFLNNCPAFEIALVNEGIILLKYWLDVSEKVQHKRFEARIKDPSRARDAMLASTDIPQAPWYVVPSDGKKRARLNCIADILSRIPYEEIPYKPPK